MTVDMLAATFFWPEGTVLGAQGLPPRRGLAPDDADATASDGPFGADEAAVADGFWATMARNLWRPASGPSTGTVG